MAFGLGLLGLAPREFWSMTPRELDAALAGRFGRAQRAAVPSSRDLAALMSRFPDEDEMR